jgi:hypothetical protein
MVARHGLSVLLRALCIALLTIAGAQQLLVDDLFLGVVGRLLELQEFLILAVTVMEHGAITVEMSGSSSSSSSGWPDFVFLMLYPLRSRLSNNRSMVRLPLIRRLPS